MVKYNNLELQHQKYGKRASQKILLFLLLTAAICYSYYLMSSFNLNKRDEIVAVVDGGNGLLKRNSFSGLDEDFCHLPQLKPFDSAITKFVKKENPIDCTQDSKRSYKRLFQIDWTGTLRAASNESLVLRSCCYLPFKPKKGLRYRAASCTQIKGNETMAAETEFIAVYCNEKKSWGKEQGTPPKLVDLLHYTPIKSNVEARLEKLKMEKKSSPSDKLPQYNVVIFGIDAVSHLNFQRTMPKSRAYLMDILSAEYLNGYTKVADNTFPNLVPVLTGLNLSELRKECWPTKKSYFDGCPFIWKNFTAAGYRTAYSEDAVTMGVFNYLKKGFKNPPTDYFLNDFMLLSAKEIGHWKRGNAILCYGPRRTSSILLENTEKLALTMGMYRRYFQFTWTGALTHDYLNLPGIIDADVLHSLQLLNTAGYLNRTVFVLMSDHGLRYGKIRETFQGKIEENMPFVYVAFPPEFHQTYARAVGNFIQNQQKLTTPFDLHEMLKDLVNLDSITDSEIRSRQESLSQREYPRGISLFLQIPANRTCERAAVQDSYCVCHSMAPIPVETPGVNGAAEAAVGSINQLLKPFQQCSELELSLVIGAHSVELRGNRTDLLETMPVEFVVLFKTKPGDALFEATMISPGKEKVEDIKSWKVAGDISRVNAYGNQSHCVDNHSMKKYCYC